MKQITIMNVSPDWTKVYPTIGAIQKDFPNSTFFGIGFYKPNTENGDYAIITLNGDGTSRKGKYLLMVWNGINPLAAAADFIKDIAALPVYTEK